MKCTATTKAGQDCRNPATTVCCGLAVCIYHRSWATQLYRHVQQRYPSNPAVRAAVRDPRNGTRIG